MHPPRENPGLSLALVAIAVAGFTLALFAPVLPLLDQVLIGDPKTDALRGLWGLDHIWNTMVHGEVPWQSTRINFPEGAQMMVLPMASSVLLAPLVGLLGPALAWNIGLILLVFALGLSVSWLGRLSSDGWLPGLLAGIMVISQPMLHHAIGDGTAEHVALWAIPLFLIAALTAAQEYRLVPGIVAGLLAILVALDSPYHGIYALIIGICVIPLSMRRSRGRTRDRRRAWAVLATAGAAAIALVLFIYTRFESGSIDGPTLQSLQASNATDLRLWWFYEGGTGVLRDPSRPQTVIPAIPLVASLVLCLVGRRQAMPWLVAGVLMLGLSLGTNETTGPLLGAWLGAPFGWIAAAAIEINKWFYELPFIGRIRFPRRWLVPAAMALSVGGAVGVQSIFRRWIKPRWAQLGLTMVLCIGLLSSGVRTSRLHRDFPIQDLPAFEFTQWLADQAEPGAVLLLPTVRQVNPGATREELPVFANLGTSLASADELYLQTQHGRPMVSFPNLQTLNHMDQEVNVRRVLRDWSDLSHPATANKAVPPSAVDPNADGERIRGMRHLLSAGLRWVVLDRGAYADKELDELRRQMGKRRIAEDSFNEGEGVLIFTLE